MSIDLPTSMPSDLEARMLDSAATGGRPMLWLGEYELSYEDMTVLIVYFMTNSNFDSDNDPRIGLRDRITKFKIVDGRGGRGKRFSD